MQDSCFLPWKAEAKLLSFFLWPFFFFFAKSTYILFMYYALMFFMADRPVNFTRGSYLAAECEFLWEGKNG